MDLSSQPIGGTCTDESSARGSSLGDDEQAAGGVDPLALLADPGSADPDQLREFLVQMALDKKVPTLLADIGAVDMLCDRTSDAALLLRSALLIAPDHESARDSLRALGDIPVTPASPPITVTGPQEAPVQHDPFAGHYHDWRQKRVTAIFERYGPAWFQGARVLEIGCGYGDIGSYFRAVGADVTFSEGRQEHLEVIAGRYPGLPANRLVRYDAEDPWPFGRYDLVINMGLVYHVNHWERSIIGATRSADRIVLETEVCDSDDPGLILKTEEGGPDQAVSGIGSRPSAEAVEALLIGEGFRFERLADNRCNSGFHRYDWPVSHTGSWEHGLRRFWFAWRDGSPLPH